MTYVAGVPALACAYSVCDSVCVCVCVCVYSMSYITV